MCSNYKMRARVLLVALLLSASMSINNSQLSTTFYSQTCPHLFSIVFVVIANASKTDPRIGASLLRLHFHDCFVQGCDASILLNNTATIESEQDAFPNINSIRGLDVVNRIKSAVEADCPDTVSCADILAISAQMSVFVGGGPSWLVPLGRRDSLTANRSLANENLPPPFAILPELKDFFSRQGLTTTDLVALSGAHTIGRGHCINFVNRLYNFNNTGNPDPTLNTNYLETLRVICPQDGSGDNNLTNLDVSTPDKFDNKYYSNLVSHKGLFQSDQELYSTPGADTITLVNTYSNDMHAFFDQFTYSIIKMGNIGVLTENQGEIRSQCNFVNGPFN